MLTESLRVMPKFPYGTASFGPPARPVFGMGPVTGHTTVRQYAALQSVQHGVLSAGALLAALGWGLRHTQRRVATPLRWSGFALMVLHAPIGTQLYRGISA